MDEFELIGRYLRPLATAPAARGLMDDTALLTPPLGQQLVLTKDMLAADVHFRASDPPAAIAAKALRVNLSDLAAKGARPEGYLLGLGLGGNEDAAWLEAFASGLAADQALYGLTLLGGDTIACPGRLVLSITALGWVPEGAMLARSGAGIGERVYVSGSLGDAALGLDLLAGRLTGLVDAAATYLGNRYLYPQPRLALGAALRGVATAAADISDGLASDIGHICAASGIGARLWLDRLPLSDAACSTGMDADALRRRAATAGDDYELVWTAPAAAEQRILAISQELGLNIACVGETQAGKGVTALDAGGRPVDLALGGYRHNF